MPRDFCPVAADTARHYADIDRRDREDEALESAKAELKERLLDGKRVRIGKYHVSLAEDFGAECAGLDRTIAQYLAREIDADQLRAQLAALVEEIAGKYASDYLKHQQDMADSADYE